LRSDIEADLFLLTQGNVYERFERESYELTKLNDGKIAGQRFILCRLQTGENLRQTLLYVVVPDGGEVRVIATEGPTGNIMLQKESSRHEMLITIDVIMKYKESMAMFGVGQGRNRNQQ